MGDRRICPYPNTSNVWWWTSMENRNIFRLWFIFSVLVPFSIKIPSRVASINFFRHKGPISIVTLRVPLKTKAICICKFGFCIHYAMLIGGNPVRRSLARLSDSSPKLSHGPPILIESKLVGIIIRISDVKDLMCDDVSFLDCTEIISRIINVTRFELVALLVSRSEADIFHMIPGNCD